MKKYRVTKWQLQCNKFAPTWVMYMKSQHPKDVAASRQVTCLSHKILIEFSVVYKNCTVSSIPRWADNWAVYPQVPQPGRHLLAGAARGDVGLRDECGEQPAPPAGRHQAAPTTAIQGLHTLGSVDIINSIDILSSTLQFYLLQFVNHYSIEVLTFLCLCFWTPLYWLFILCTM